MDFPWRTETNAWLALAAEVLLQRTRAQQVLPVYAQLRDSFPTPEHVADANVKEIDLLFGPLGLHWRAKYFRQMGEFLRDRGNIPEDEESLRQIPSVGPYAAAAYLSLHRGRRAVIVDANVVRWLGRLFGFSVDGETRRQRWLIDLADRLTPKRSVRDYNYAVLDFTMAICAQRPRCDECPLRFLPCSYATSVAQSLP